MWRRGVLRLISRHCSASSSMSFLHDREPVQARLMTKLGFAAVGLALLGVAAPASLPASEATGVCALDAGVPIEIAAVGDGSRIFSTMDGRRVRSRESNSPPARPRARRCGAFWPSVWRGLSSWRPRRRRRIAGEAFPRVFSWEGSGRRRARLRWRRRCWSGPRAVSPRSGRIRLPQWAARARKRARADEGLDSGRRASNHRRRRRSARMLSGQMGMILGGGRGRRDRRGRRLSI